jgi:hypothetical protein
MRSSPIWRCIRPIIIHAHTRHTYAVDTHSRVLHTRTLYIMMQIHIPQVSTQPIPAPEFIWALRSKERVQVFTAGNVLYRYPYMVYPRVSIQMTDIKSTNMVLRSNRMYFIPVSSILR